MKAAIFHGPGKMTIETRDIPLCPEGGALVKLFGSTICGSDAKIYRNGHPKIVPPQIIGHESCGQIVEIKAGDSPLKVGDRVTIQTSIPCGSCGMCKRGIYNLCENITAISWEHPGTFAQYIAIPAKAVELGNVVKVPDHLTHEEVCLAEPLACVINSQNFLNIEPGQTVLVIGAGPTGILQAELARLKGAQVIVAQRSERRLQLARQFGYRGYIDTQNGDLVEETMKLTHNRGVDVCIVTAPVQSVQEQALHTLAYRGKISLFGSLGVGKSDLKLDNRLIHYKELSVFGCASSTAHQIEQALNVLATGGIRTSGIITHTLPLDNLVDGINMSINGEGLKIYIRNW
ncbi:zinc-binding dehydrogenase [Cohnella nanjingensis]|uniref:Alcohol dehydrogenase catalytic domain-containing protein n=1 Tax=Cohnella nanjingensis TaxID=1387779 RepID=A0A7X0RNJ2_9BACL|nr:alcohol dehydrogenase catalytic domain-containing protein [Cohnella nanjingensis]MBB6670797.1 alcohol dehydrogenase catalytic domain-containing protein [Cohnella nanjingensis]